MEVKRFDELVDLWSNDPEAAQAYHREVLDDFIRGLPEDRQEMARARQWRLEQELSHYVDPVARLNRMIELMFESFFDLNDALHGRLPENRKYEADVIPIGRKTDD